MPQVSVLMPVYNSEKYLSEAIDSILNQTLTDFEFIIIDDGSTDSSVAIVQSYSDPRIRFYQNNANLGISKTLNEGIALANTDFIARMDADDISYPDRLSKQYAYMQANPDCAMVSSLVKVITENGQFMRQDVFKSEYFYYNLVFVCWIYHPTVMYRKAAVGAVNMYTESYSEDFELFWQLSRKYRIYNMPEVMLDYRVTNQSLHQVQKKKEYEIAQQEQVMRNLRYFVGEDYQLPLSYLECYRHNFKPLIAENNLQTIISCIRELDLITKHIVDKDNVNRDIQAIKRAAIYKRRFIIDSCSQQLSSLQKAILVTLLESPKFLIKSFLTRILSVLVRKSQTK